MALTFTTGMTLASAADSATNWQVARISGGGQAPTFGGLDNAVFKQGTGSVSAKIATTNTDAVILLDWYANTEGGKTGNTTVNLSTSGNEVVSGWVQLTTISAVLAWASGGLYLLISSSTDSGTTAPTVYSKWYIGGSDGGYPGGWVFFQVDTRKTASTTAGGGVNLAAVRRVGFGIFRAGTPASNTIKADNLFVDAIWYGQPIYELNGDGTLVADWDSFLTDSNTNDNGLVEDIGGAQAFSAGIRFGNGTQTATTSFIDESGKKIIFKRYTYNTGSSVVDALNYSDYYIVEADGASGFKTLVRLGLSVGGGDAKTGVLGGSISVADIDNMTFTVDFATNTSNLSAVLMYGVQFLGGHETIDFADATIKNTEIISCTFINCGEITTGTSGNGITFLNCTVIDPDSNIDSENRGLRIKSGTTNTKRVSFITSGTPSTQHMTHLPDTGTVSYNFNALIFYGSYASGTRWHGEDSANNTNTITINASNGSNPTQSEFATTGTPSGTVAVVNTVTLTVRGVTSDNEPTTYARVSMHLVSTGAEIFKADASTVDDLNAGFYKASFSYNYQGSVQVKVRARYSSTGGTKYKNFETVQTITSSGLDVTAVWIKDTIAT